MVARKRRIPASRAKVLERRRPVSPGAGLFHQRRPSGEIRSTYSLQSYGHQVFQPLPPPTGASPYHLSLDSILPASAIKDSGTMTLHVGGDTGGVQNPAPQQQVADAMELDFSASATDQIPFFSTTSAT